MYFATAQVEDFTKAIAALDTLEVAADMRITIAVLSWAAARLANKPDAARADLLLRLRRLRGRHTHCVVVDRH